MRKAALVVVVCSLPALSSVTAEYAWTIDKPPFEQ